MLRTTWHAERGFFNVSLWRDNRCVETFHLSLPAAAELIAFVVDNLAGPRDRERVPPGQVLVSEVVAWREAAPVGTRQVLATRARRRLADLLEQAATALRR